MKSIFNSLIYASWQLYFTRIPRFLYPLPSLKTYFFNTVAGRSYWYGQSHENWGGLFRAFRTGTAILTFVNFFCVFSTSFVPWYKKTKILKNNFFRAYANASVYFIYTNDTSQIIRSQFCIRICSKKIIFLAFWLFGFLYHGTKLIPKNEQNTDISYCAQDKNWLLIIWLASLV